MKNIFLITLLLLTVSCIGFSQSNGTTPEVLRSSSDSGTSRAVIIGISDYQNEDIPDLQFAHKDAAAFADYLKSPAGGSLTDEQLKLLLNDDATTAQIAAAFEWLVEVSKEGDQAVIYFSGHGDVETKTMFQLGYLLTWDSPARTYVAGAFPLSYLQAVVSTLSLQNKAEVALITDACRAGKLAGTNVGGAQITNANLSKQFASEVKILSCQPDEFSLEGTQWGGGRGVFSYHLLDGLYGMADNNEDLRVNLFEIGRYLEDKVSNETDPHSQFPMVVGSKNTTVAVVNEQSLALLKEKRMRETPTLNVVESKGFEDMILADVDSVWQKKYREFTAAIDEGRLLDSPTDEAAAYDLYVELSKASELQKLNGTMQRNLAAALQDDAQQAINAYLEANPTELAKRYSAETNYEQHPRYLRKAAEILGTQNFYYPYIMAKLYYFEGLQIRLDADKEVGNISYEKAIELQTKALEFQEYAPFVLNELGVLHTRLKLSEKAINSYKKAIDLAPEWGLPYVNLCLEHYYNNDTDKAMEIGKKAIELMPDYPQLYNLLGWINADYFSHYDKRNWKRKGVELRRDFMYDYDNQSSSSQLEKKFERTIELLTKAIEIDSNYAAAHANIGQIYIQLNQVEKTIFHLKKATQLDPANDIIFGRLGHVYIRQNKCAEGEKAYQEAIELTIEDTPTKAALWFNGLGILYKDCGNREKALEAYQKAIDLKPNYGFPYLNAASVYLSLENFKKAEWHYLKSQEVNSHYPPTYYSLGQFYQSINRYEDAERMYLKAIEMKPDFVKAFNDLINFYQEKSDNEKAEEWQKRLLEIAPNDLITQQSAGQLAYLMKEDEKAEEHFQRVINLDTLGHSNFNSIGWFYKNHGDYEQAEKYLKLCIATDYYSPYPYSNLAQLYHSFGQLKESIEILDKGLISNPNDKLLREMKTTLSYFAFSTEQSKLIFEEAAKTQPAFLKVWDFLEQIRKKEYTKATQTWKEFEGDIYTFYFVHIYLGALVQNGDMVAAIELMNKTAIYSLNYQLMATYPLMEPLRKETAYQSYMRRKFPEKYDDLDTFEFQESDPIYYFENCLPLAKHYESQNKNERANFLYQKAIELKPDSVTNNDAMVLAEAFLKSGQLEKARAICPEEIDSEKEDDLLKAGKLYFMLRNKEQASLYFDKYIKLSNKAQSINNVGIFYKDHGEYDLAETSLKAGIKMDTEAMDIRRTLARLYFFFDKKDEAYQVLQEAIHLQPNNVSTQGVHYLLSYYDQPETSKNLFEKPGFLSIWEGLELMRQNQFAKADTAWQSLQKQYTQPWMEFAKYKYLQMKIRQGETESALQIFRELLAEGTFVNYQLYKTDKELDPIRNSDGFKELMRQYFPEK